jgi:hypothetical protein
MDQEHLFIIARRVAAQTQYQRDLQWWNGCCPPPDSDKPKYWKEDIDSRTYNEIISSKQKTIINWIKPDIESEMEEFQRTAKERGLDVEDMLKKAAKGWTQKMPNEMWSVLENTDSYTIGSMEDAEKLAAEYGKDLASINDAISKGQTLPSPIVLIGNGLPYLIAGNTRLMVSKALGVTPEVFFFDLSDSDSPMEMADMPSTGRVVR